MKWSSITPMSANILYLWQNIIIKYNVYEFMIIQLISIPTYIIYTIVYQDNNTPFPLILCFINLNSMVFYVFHFENAIWELRATTVYRIYVLLFNCRYRYILL